MVIPPSLQKKFSPEARALSFFITDNDVLVADSSKFQVDPVCQSELEMDTAARVYPNENGELRVAGAPHMVVGLNVMDEALLLLNDKHVLRRSKMFEMMKSHDLGCGEGGGSNAADVFRDAGVTVLTDASLNEPSLQRDSLGCGTSRRKKRSIDCDEGSKPKCCKFGERYAKDVLKKNAKKKRDIDVETTCYGKIKAMSDLRKKKYKYKYSLPCLISIYEKCMEVLRKEVTGLQAKSVQDASNSYLEALLEFDIDGDIPVRKNFRDSWLFEVVTLDGEGNSEQIQLRFPSSITDWMIQAVGITDNLGMCISQPTSVTAFKPVFIQLDMPYKASRFEYFDLKVTVFNYKKGNNAKFKLFLDPVKGLCMNADEPGKKKMIGNFSLDGNEAFSVRVPVLAIEARRFPMKVTLLGKMGQESIFDAIEKPLLVVNEGIEVQEKITVCLEPFTRKDITDCVNSDRVNHTVTGAIQTSTVNMTLPDKALIHTGRAFGYASSNVMDDIIRTLMTGIDSMFRKPTGCAEQTASKLGPTVYVMSYWKATEQMNSNRERQGNTWIREGVQHEFTYKKADGSYGYWANASSRSRWLTAFVAKIFCQAKKVVDDAVITSDHVEPTLEWLERKIQESNLYTDNQPERAAFVLISLLECTSTNEAVKTKLRSYLENLPDSTYTLNPLLLAMSTYALAMEKSPQRYRMKNLLLRVSNYDNQKDFRYWGAAQSYYASSIETTGYAVLALLQFENGLTEVLPSIRWLTDKRKPQGTFSSTQDTVVALQALTEYQIKSSSPIVDLDIKLSAHDWEGREQTLTSKNSDLLETINDIPVKEGERTLKIVTKGIGSGRLTIDYRYNRKESKYEECAFKISDIDIGTVDEDIDENKVFLDNTNLNRTCDVCTCQGSKGNDDTNILGERKKMNADADADAGDNVSKKGKQHCVTFSVRSLNNMKHGMSIIDVGLETGMRVVEADIQKLLDEGLISNYELPENDKGFLILYLDEITSKRIEYKFRLEEDFGIELRSRQPSRIHVYDYYHPERECISFYGTGKESGSPVDYNCEEKTTSMPATCNCLKTVCPIPDMINELYHMKKTDDKKPAKELYDDICVRRKYTFAALMRVTKITVDHDKQIRIAEATVTESIHRGSDDLSTGTKISVYWRMYCDKTVLEKDKSYYLLSTDGERYTNGYRYQLMGQAAVIEWTDITTIPKKYSDRSEDQKVRRFVQQMMDKFVKITKKGCKM